MKQSHQAPLSMETRDDRMEREMGKSRKNSY